MVTEGQKSKVTQPFAPSDGPGGWSIHILCSLWVASRALFDVTPCFIPLYSLLLPNELLSQELIAPVLFWSLLLNIIPKSRLWDEALGFGHGG